jgi:ornithine cyclodeaminase/alanine dehydrogenase-like protein (mu-crystallin family)
MKLDFIDAAAIHNLLDWPYLIESMRQAHREAPPMIGRLALENPHPDRQSDVLIAAPAWIPGQDLGCKLITSFPENSVRYGVPTINSIYAVFDPQTGRPRAILDGEAMIFRKTAATSALAADYLASPEAKRMVMVGAGALAPFLIQAMRTVRPGLEEVRIWNRSPKKAQRLAQDMDSPQCKMAAVQDREGALKWADIVVAATMSETPIIAGSVVRDSAHVNLIGAFTAAMREGDDALLTRADLYIDHRARAAQNGEFKTALESGLISQDDLLGDLFDIVKLTPSTAGYGCLANPDGVTLFKNAGASHLDLFTARALMARYP